MKTKPIATHAFTNPDATTIGKKFNMPIEYNKKADMDFWNDMKMFFNTILKKQDRCITPGLMKPLFRSNAFFTL